MGCHERPPVRFMTKAGVPGALGLIEQLEPGVEGLELPRLQKQQFDGVGLV